MVSGFQLASAGAHCDYALFAGATEFNFTTVPELSSAVAGLKMYLNDTFTTLKMENITTWKKVSPYRVTEYWNLVRFPVNR